MLDAPQLQVALREIPAIPIAGVLYRAVNNRFLANLPAGVQPQPLYSQTSSDFGGRYTPRGGPPMLYLAEDPATAFAEGNGIGELVQSSSPATALPTPPTTLFSVEIEVARVLDLADPALLERLETSSTELLLPWRLQMERAANGIGEQPATQRLGVAAFAEGNFQAIRYPSAQMDGHFCVVLFVDRIVEPSFAEVHDPDGLYPQRIPYNESESEEPPVEDET